MNTSLFGWRDVLARVRGAIGEGLNPAECNREVSYATSMLDTIEEKLAKLELAPLPETASGYRDRMAGLRGIRWEDQRALVDECMRQAGLSDAEIAEVTSLGRNICMRIADAAHRAGAAGMKDLMSRPAPNEPPIFVVVASRDGCKLEPGEECRGPIVWETYTRGATREDAVNRAGQLERVSKYNYGACRIARLVWDD